MSAAPPVSPQVRSSRKKVLIEDRRGDERHDRHERLGQHPAVADEPHLAFLLQQFQVVPDEINE